MTEVELTHAIIALCNKAFDKKDPITNNFIVRRDVEDLYPDLLCLVKRYTKGLAPKKKKRKSSILD